MMRALSIALVAWLALAAPAIAAEPEIGEVAPTLQATELNGRAFDLSTLRGKVVIVNFWATWCGPCRVEMPALDKFYRAFRDQGLVLIGVSVDKWDDRGKVANVMRDFSYPAAMVNEAATNEFPRPKVIPTTYIVDRDGVLRGIEHGATPETLARAVLPLLKEKSAPAPSGMSASAR